MGACCRKLFGRQPQPLEQSTNRTELVSKVAALSLLWHTANDHHFTYFLEVFSLSKEGKALKRPEFANQGHPHFSPQEFQQHHQEYHRLVQQLGKYINNRKDRAHQLRRRVEEDCKKIEQGRQRVGFGKSKLPGCLVKLEIQGVFARGVEEVTVRHQHPQQWSGKFEQSFKLAQLKAGPIFLEFVVPQIFTSKVRLVGSPKHFQLQFSLNECFEEGRITFCQVMGWPGAAEGEGVAVRMQLCEGEEGERMQALQELYRTLMKEFQGLAMQRESVSKQEVMVRMSRHRSSLNEQYNLNNNSMF